MRNRTLALVAATLMLVQACGFSASDSAPSVTPTPTGTASSHAAVPGGVDVRLEVPQTSVMAGTPIHATLVVDNRTGNPIKANCGLHYAAGVTNSQIRFKPAFTLACQLNAFVARGATRYQVLIITTYSSCSQSGHAGGTRPGCVGQMGAGGVLSEAPPLPRGTYQTSLVLNGIPMQDVHLPSPIVITLT